MTTLDQREEHKKQSVLNGYRKALLSNNTLALNSLKERYPQYSEEFAKCSR